MKKSLTGETVQSTVKTMSEEVREYVRRVASMGGRTVTRARLDALKKARTARSEYCKQRRENKHKESQ